MAAYVFDNKPPPPDLSRALNYQAWGVVDIMNLPAGMLSRMNTALSYYRVLIDFQKAAAQSTAAQWSKQHPKEWELVSWVLAERKEGRL